MKVVVVVVVFLSIFALGLLGYQNWMLQQRTSQLECQVRSLRSELEVTQLAVRCGDVRMRLEASYLDSLQHE